MACFLVPAAEAVITTIAAKVTKSREASAEQAQRLQGITTTQEKKIPFSRKIRWLNNMLWGGSALLAFEHIWHGEVTPWFPFLTAAGEPEAAAEMLHEMATAGVAMAALVTVVWLGMVAASSVIEKRSAAPAPAEEQEA